MAEFSLQGAADIAAQQDKGTRVVLRNHLGDTLTYTDTNGEVVEVYATVAGTLSNTYRRAEDAQRDRQLKRRSVTLTSEQLTQQQIALTAACVLEWNLRDGGKPIPCTPANVSQVLNAAPYIRADIEAAMTDAARFLG